MSAILYIIIFGFHHCHKHSFSSCFWPDFVNCYAFHMASSLDISWRILEWMFLGDIIDKNAIGASNCQGPITDIKSVEGTTPLSVLLEDDTPLYFIFELAQKNVLFILANCRYNEEVSNNFHIEDIQIGFIGKLYSSHLKIPFSFCWITENEDLWSASTDKEEGWLWKDYFFNEVMLDRLIHWIELHFNMIWKLLFMLHLFLLWWPELELPFQRWDHKHIFGDLDYTCDGSGLHLEKGILILENEHIISVCIYVVWSRENARLIWAEKSAVIVLFRNLFNLDLGQGVIGGWVKAINNTSFQFQAVKYRIIDDATGQFAGFIERYVAIMAKELNSFEWFFDPGGKFMFFVTEFCQKAKILSVVISTETFRYFDEFVKLCFILTLAVRLHITICIILIFMWMEFIIHSILASIVVSFHCWICSRISIYCAYKRIAFRIDLLSSTFILFNVDQLLLYLW